MEKIKLKHGVRYELNNGDVVTMHASNDKSANPFIANSRTYYGSGLTALQTHCVKREFKLIDGESYKMRNGRTVKMITRTNIEDSKFFVFVSSEADLYTEDGRYFKGDNPNECDIVATVPKMNIAADLKDVYKFKFKCIDTVYTIENKETFHIVLKEKNRLFRLLQNYVDELQNAMDAPDELSADVVDGGFRLEVGKTYVTRDGEIVSILEFDDDPDVKYAFACGKRCWESNGKYTSADKHDKDLVKEYKE